MQRRETPNPFASLWTLSLLAASMVGLVSCGNRDLPNVLEQQVTRTLETYVRALRTADTNLLSQVFTGDYLRDHGGLEGWARRLAEDKRKSQGLSLGAVTIKPHTSDTNAVFVQFTLRHADGKAETMEDSRVWWRLIQVARGNWQVDDVLHDFEPQHLGAGR